VAEASDEVLAVAAAAEQQSAHPLAAAIRSEAAARGLSLETADEFHEAYGDGVEALVNGKRTRVGRASFVGIEPDRPALAGIAEVWVSVDGGRSGVIRCSDQLRDGAPLVVDRIRRTGSRPLLLTGDSLAVATAVGSALGIDDIRADATPESKAQAVGALRQAGETVVMVGDGLNDAPALAAADVGIALGATGSTISSDAADAVVLVDDLGRIAEALEIGRDTLAIARTGIVLGMGLSAVLMIIAAFGGITPLQGAIAQEAVDVAAILNALRALHGPGKASRPRSRITRARRAAKLA
jgi:P-type E1-E2 ATPase